VIPKVDFVDITLSDALKILNEEIAKQTPDDQPRVRILLHPYFNERFKSEAFGEIESMRIDELRLRNVPVVVLLKYMCDKTKNIYWFYKGDFYVSPIINDGGIGYFYYAEKISRVKLDNIDASQLTHKLNEIIDEHNYFGPKTSISILMTEKARDALLKGEVQLPRINLDLHDVTLNEAMRKISQHTHGALRINDADLQFDPFDEWNVDPFAEAGTRVSFGVKLDENIFKPKSDDPFE
jgi:hypothetical protein